MWKEIKAIAVRLITNERGFTWTAFAIYTAAVASVATTTTSAHQQGKRADTQADIAQSLQAAESKKAEEAAAKMESDSLQSAADAKTAAGTAAELERKESRRRRASRSKTLLTSPKGAMGEASTTKKTLLGG